MSDTERLNLIEHYRWNILFTSSGSVLVVSTSAAFKVEGETLKQAISMAMDAQTKWSLG